MQYLQVYQKQVYNVIKAAHYIAAVIIDKPTDMCNQLLVRIDMKYYLCMMMSGKESYRTFQKTG